MHSYSNNYSELYHYGVKGMNWGERRWQNEDGSLTEAGYIHYGYAKKNKKTGEVKYNQKAIDARNARLQKKLDKDKAKGDKIADYAQAVRMDQAEYAASHGIWFIYPDIATTVAANVMAYALKYHAGSSKAKRQLIKQGLYYTNSILNDSSSTKPPASKSSSSRVTGKEESDFWKAYAAQQTAKKGV